MNSGAPNFDRVARPYRLLEYLTLGRTLEHTRFHFLPQLASRTRALVLGDGDGRFLTALLSQNPRLHAHAVDSSGAMLTLLRKRLERNPSSRAHGEMVQGGFFLRKKPPDGLAPTSGDSNSDFALATAANRTETHNVDAQTFAEGLPHIQNYDLVTTHFFLDCLTQAQVETLVATLTPHLTPGALWLVSDFRIPTGLLALPARLFVRGLYGAFRLLTGLRVTRLPDHHRALARAGMVLTAQHFALYGLLTTELWRKP